MKEIEKMANRKKLFHAGKSDIYNFQQFYTIKSLARNIFNNKISLDKADEDQIELLI